MKKTNGYPRPDSALAVFVVDLVADYDQSAWIDRDILVSKMMRDKESRLWGSTEASSQTRERASQAVSDYIHRAKRYGMIQVQRDGRKTYICVTVRARKWAETTTTSKQELLALPESSKKRERPVSDELVVLSLSRVDGKVVGQVSFEMSEARAAELTLGALSDETPLSISIDAINIT